MYDKDLWIKETERDFFIKTLDVATPEQLFYITNNGEYIAYWPNNYRGRKTTLQSRNSFIGSFTESWVRKILEPIGNALNAYILNDVICEDIGLTRNSPADVAICKTNRTCQSPDDIMLIIEVKMSIVWNWRFDKNKKNIVYLGDYTTHTGVPSLLRSDTVLKAIGKSVNIRVSSPKSSKVPIIVLGNTPITRHYYNLLDNLKRTGIIQGFFSLNPAPLDNLNNESNIKSTPKNGFIRIDSFRELQKVVLQLINSDKEFFSGMENKNRIGQFVEMANKEPTYEKKGEVFLKMLRESNDF